ncbi:helix-turn-helix transcriptional regulator [Candidatus Acetothermia bacterium]|nr:helix-turn-helix transcriptional regulator [Candidatus Acetothermia bacterium]
MATLTHVAGAEQMMVGARIAHQGIYVQFADEASGVIPLADLQLAGRPASVDLPDPYVLHIELTNGNVEEVPWDFARHYADVNYRAQSEKAGRRGLKLLGKRIQKLRINAGFTQEELAKRSKLGRITLVRLEMGQHSPRFETLVALAKGLDCDVSELM